jgi:hypothetical protein
MPESAIYAIDAGSARVLIYDSAELKHRVLIFGEADSLPAGEDNSAASAIRNLLQEHRLRYDVVQRSEETGEYCVKHISKDGPTVLCVTSTRTLGEQLNTRVFTLEISDSHEQIVAALDTQAGLEVTGTAGPDPALVAYQSWLQLSAPIKVTVPFAARLARGMSGMAQSPRILRDFARVLSLIKVVALIRQHHRQTDSGRIVATLDDYDYVRALIGDMFAETVSGATLATRTLTEAVTQIEKSKQAFEKITNVTLASHLGIGPMAAGRQAKRALRMGWLVNKEQRKYHPADYGSGEAMPPIQGLPEITHDNSLEIQSVITKTSTKTATDNTITPLTAGTTPPPILCNKGTGNCAIRTDPSLKFSCVESPESCPFNTRITPGITPNLTPIDAQMVETPRTEQRFDRPPTSHQTIGGKVDDD